MSAYLTVAAVAEDLGVSMRTVSRWIAAGELEALRLPGGGLRIPQSGYDDWKRAHLAVSRQRTLVALDEEVS